MGRIMATTKKTSKAKKTASKAKSKVSSASKTKALAASRARKKTVATKAAAPKKAAPKTAPKKAATSRSEAAATVASQQGTENVINMFSPENFVENSPFKNADAFKDMITGGSSEWQKIQEKCSRSGEEVAAHFERSSEAISNMAAESTEALQRSATLASEMSNKTTEVSQEAINSWFDFSNQFWSDTIEQSKEFLNCRNANDVFDLQNKLIQHATESLYKQASQSSEKMFETMADMVEPAQEEAAKATENFFANLAK